MAGAPCWRLRPLPRRRARPRTVRDRGNCTTATARPARGRRSRPPRSMPRRRAVPGERRHCASRTSHAGLLWSSRRSRGAFQLEEGEYPRVMARGVPGAEHVTAARPSEGVASTNRSRGTAHCCASSSTSSHPEDATGSFARSGEHLFGNSDSDLQTGKLSQMKTWPIWREAGRLALRSLRNPSNLQREPP